MGSLSVKMNVGKTCSGGALFMAALAIGVLVLATPVQSMPRIDSALVEDLGSSATLATFGKAKKCYAGAGRGQRREVPCQDSTTSGGSSGGVHGASPATPGGTGTGSGGGSTSGGSDSTKCKNQLNAQTLWDKKYGTFTSGDLSELGIPARPSVDKECAQTPSLGNDNNQGGGTQTPPKEDTTTPPKDNTTVNCWDPAAKCSPTPTGNRAPGSPPPGVGIGPKDVVEDKKTVTPAATTPTQPVTGYSSGGGGGGGGGGGSSGGGSGKSKPSASFNFSASPNEDGPPQMDCSVEGRRAKSSWTSSESSAQRSSGHVTRGVVTKDLVADEKCEEAARKDSIRAPDANDPGKGDVRLKY